MSDKLTAEQVNKIKYKASLWMNPGSPIPCEGDAKVVEQLADDWHRLTAKNAELVAALEFYSYGANWKSVAIIEDDGEIARTALEKR